MEYKEPFKMDKRGLWYLDIKDIILKEIYFPQYVRPYGHYDERKPFYEIEGMDNILVKDSSEYPFFFNHTRNRNLIEKLYKKQEEIPEVDFTLGYLKGFTMMKGILVPYYKGGISVQRLATSYSFRDIKNYYNHESNEMDNLFSILLDILHLLIIMYNKGVYYTDANSGNFIIYNNEIKVIDFEPEFVFFSDNSGKHLNKSLKKYTELVNAIFKRYGLNNLVFTQQEDYYKTEEKVLELRKRIER